MTTRLTDDQVIAALIPIADQIAIPAEECHDIGDVAAEFGIDLSN